MNQQQKKQLKARSNLLAAAARVGKQGLTEKTVNEVEKLLKKRKLVKIKILKSALESKDKKEYAKELAQKTGSELIENIGFTVVLYKNQA